MDDRDIEAILLKDLKDYEQRSGRCIISVTVDTEVLREPGGGTAVTMVMVRSAKPSGAYRMQLNEDTGA